ncbi:MAG: glycosidase [Deltaproteobacteria bacterium]|nr:glycosidase [Deltaproteobacteria bacterium]
MLKRFLNNPILKPKRENPWESKLVFNPAAIYHNGIVHLLYRAVGDDNISRIGYAMSSNGFEFFRLNKPVFTPRGILESKGCEDPRLVLLDDQFYMTYTSYSAQGPRVSIASTRNFLQWERYGVVLPELNNKDAVLFPEKVSGKYVMFHRPISPPRSIWIAFSDDLVDWHDSKKIMEPVKGRWDGVGIGSASPPVKTEKGWLLIFHGVDEESVYRLGVALFDLEDPSRLLSRHPEPILEPEEDYELHGEVKEVVFATGICEIEDTYYIYYGAADRVICGATVDKKVLLDLAGA